MHWQQALLLLQGLWRGLGSSPQQARQRQQQQLVSAKQVMGELLLGKRHSIRQRDSNPATAALPPRQQQQQKHKKLVKMRLSRAPLLV
jgi:hypothetical protein